MHDAPPLSFTYAHAGVDTAAAARLTARIAPLLSPTATRGGFAATITIGGSRIVTSTDGVGTKTLLAVEAGLVDGLGQDCFAVCVNDIATCAATPRAFLDYIATAALDAPLVERIVTAIATVCTANDCQFVGGETAQMPGVYQPQAVDVVGFIIGEQQVAPPPGVDALVAGDVLIGVAADGLHANGFSLIRALLRHHRWSLTAVAPFAHEQTLAEALLKPTPLYHRLAQALAGRGVVKAMAHISGGGLVTNVTRLLPKWLSAYMYANWPLPPLLDWLRVDGRLTVDEIRATFHCGIGFALVTAAADVDDVLSICAACGHEASVVGDIAAGDGHARWRDRSA